MPLDPVIALLGAGGLSMTPHFTLNTLQALQDLEYNKNCYFMYRGAVSGLGAWRCCEDVFTNNDLLVT